MSAPADTAGRATSPSPPQWTAGLADTLLWRVNPVPGRRFGDPDLVEAVRVLTAATTRCRAFADGACAEVYALAGGQTAGRRHQLLALKRAIYNGRDPGPAAAGEWSGAIGAWLTSYRHGAAAAATIRAGYRTHLAAERVALAEALDDEALRRGLALVSPQMYDAVDRYRQCVAGAPANGGRGDPSARVRKSERGIVQYLTRAMVRTSPLSWFTAVGFAVWAPGGVPLDEPVVDLDVARSFVTLDRVLFTAAVTGLVEPPPGTVPAVLARNATVRGAADGVRFQRRVSDEVHLVETPLTPQLAVLLELTSLGPVPTNALAEAVAHRLGIDPVDGAEVLAAAVAVQLLVAGPAIDDQAAEPLPLARDLLGPTHPADALLAALGREIVEVSGRSSTHRQAALRRIERLQDALNAQTTRPARLHLNEDVLMPTTAVTDRGYQAALHDLSNVLELAAVFDANQALRSMLCAVFVERFGAGARVNLLVVGQSLADEVVERTRRLAQMGAGDVGGRSGAEAATAQLVSLREQARARLAAEVRAHAGDEEVWLPSDALAQLADGVPQRLRQRAASYGVLVQPVGGRLVCNAIYGGHNLLGMRFLGPYTLMPPASGPLDVPVGEPVDRRVAARVTRLFDTGDVRLREDRGLHGSNVNHRTRLLDDVIDPAGWFEVALTHDRDTDEVTLTEADGTPLRVLYFGLRWVETLPAPLRIAMWLADTSQVVFDPIGWAWRAAQRAVARDGDDMRPEPSATPTVQFPRLVAGDVVLARRRWYPGADFPAAPAASDEAGYLLDVTQWRAAHGVPEEIVAKVVPEPMTDIDATAALAWYQRVRRRGKPQYVDLTSALLVRVLPKLLERRGGGFLEEALPGVHTGRHAHEWVVEFDRPPDGRFRADRP